MRTDTRRWGSWRLHDHKLLGPVLEREWGSPSQRYWIELNRCTSSAEVLDAIVHTSRHSWADDATLAGLVRALDDVLNPISNLCGGGRSTKLRPRRLGEVFAQALAR